ncbi:hypothetical protein [Aurantimonas endophytica]|uniref:Secreted protein n=1 Tax=Aurantimonas endophytica TaxID=1522175 RepID=A0A7W6HG91_9HYPH|nr:hypothetical protein [Aurantimonas endophytica]MBB4004471.1 hypothetical protein [Aurantimonas endophytica]MCO6405307.1 hypothetical protein [Aurantimonas endophytica]
MRISRASLAFAAMPLLMAGTASATDRDDAEHELPEPVVIMEAEPPPPFTYWAPEGSTIINHPRGDGVWIAEQEDGPAVYYYGDQCKASEFQKYVGIALESLPTEAPGHQLRFACTECAVTSELKFERMNIWFDEETDTIEEISCG